MKKIVALIYQSYAARKLLTPYFKALMTVVGGILMILAIVWGLLQTHFLNPFTVSDKRGINLLVGGVFVFLLLAVFSLVYKKKDLDRYNFTGKQLKRATIYIAVYFLTLIIILSFAVFLRAKHIL